MLGRVRLARERFARVKLVRLARERFARVKLARRARRVRWVLWEWTGVGT
jgi:hypothetical protein